MKKIIVLGAGMVGSAMAADLAGKFRVAVADISRSSLNRAKARNSGLTVMPFNISDKSKLQTSIAPFDLVVCAVPGFMGFETLKNVIESGKNVVDISFFPEDALKLDAVARRHGVTAVVDCGVAPGMGNIILGHYNKRMKIKAFECLVGGLPKVRKWPFNYKAPFSPVDVLEEYIRPARFIENGKIVVKEALSDVELIEFEGIGTLEAFNSDGLRSLLKTMPHILHMKEKTLRYPGHAEYIRVLKSAGFFDTQPMKAGNGMISPMEFTSRILFRDWKLGDEEPEFTVMRITLKGKNMKGENTMVIYDLYDEYDPVTKTASMARTTGYTATAVADLLLHGGFTGKGIFPPELIGGEPGVFEYVTAYLEERGVVCSKTISTE